MYIPHKHVDTSSQKQAHSAPPLLWCNNKGNVNMNNAASRSGTSGDLQGQKRTFTFRRYALFTRRNFVATKVRKVLLFIGDLFAVDHSSVTGSSTQDMAGYTPLTFRGERRQALV